MTYELAQTLTWLAESGSDLYLNINDKSVYRISSNNSSNNNSSSNRAWDYDIFIVWDGDNEKDIINSRRHLIDYLQNFEKHHVLNYEMLTKGLR